MYLEKSSITATLTDCPGIQVPPLRAIIRAPDSGTPLTCGEHPQHPWAILRQSEPSYIVPGIGRIHATVGIAEADFAPHPGTRFFFESRYIERQRRGRAGLHAMVYLGGRDLGRDTNEGLGHFRFDRRHNGALNIFVASLVVE